MAAPDRLRAKAGLVSLLVLALVACQAPAPREDGPGREATSTDPEIAQWRAEAMDWRQRRLARLTEPHGWLSLVALEPLSEGRWLIGSDEGNHFRVSSGPEHWGDLVVIGERVWFEPARPGAVRIDGLPAEGETELLALRDEGPTEVEAGSVQFHLMPRAGQPYLRIRDSESPVRTGFRGLDYFPFDPDWRITARWVPNPPGQTLLIANVLGELNQDPNPGMAEFEVDGRTVGLQAVLSEDGQELFFILADRTSGRETYGLGRFLYSELPENGEVVLDFNRTYNPPCAFTEYSTCPLPPPENRLDLRIEAGELKY
ncbi:DUF1684 domain-containing protein [Wenzhouxiangella marina]|uniref:Uncharacterized protein n=1 Tax=Wenzhouxiangella marina TaxID=1579979 RepID=A0A0K0XXP4_9GAMM|nr:DUF1684 domain-containing protein [Wenzhouxiangella marina]AKS42381.1 hypothetical protein WM2015_2015 [Wenzhouxiangella marina]MBB6085846.1 hypothetical protein [Wenzhouxiangella marina]